MRALALAVVSLAAAVAHADSDDIISRPLTLARGQVEARVAFESSLGTSLRPLSISPDVWAGLTDRLTVGITHSASSLDRIAIGGSFCVREEKDTCDRTYQGSAIDVRWSAVRGEVSVAPRARLMLRDIEPVKPALALGAQLRWQSGRVMIESDPYLRLGLGNRDLGNRAYLTVPIWFGIQPTCRWLLAAHMGWDSDIAVWRDGWHGPLSLLVRARATMNLDVSFEARFSSMFGPQNNIKQSAMVLAFSWRTD